MKGCEICGLEASGAVDAIMLCQTHFQKAIEFKLSNPADPAAYNVAAPVYRCERGEHQHAAIAPYDDCLACTRCGERLVTGENLAALGLEPRRKYDRRRTELADECGRLLEENRALALALHRAKR